MSTDEITVRPAVRADDSRLLAVDRLTQTTLTTPGQYNTDKATFFGTNSEVCDHLVAEVGGEVVGYVMLVHPTPLASHQHVMQIGGVAVAPGHQGHGIGKALMVAAIAELKGRGVSKVGLRVLGWNEPALRLYRSCGFETEGVLQGEFLLDGVLVDDHLMARWISEPDV